MPSGPGERYDFFLSRRGSVAAIAQEVTDVLKEKGYKVCTQDYDIPITANFIEEMHEAVKNSRDLVVLFTRDYEQSPYTRMEFTSFEANAAQSAEKRRMVILRCEDAPLLGLFAAHVYQDLVGIVDAEERRSRILAALDGRSAGIRAAAATIHWGTAAHCELHRPCWRTRPARRHSHTREARCRDPGVGRPRGGAGYGRRGQDFAGR
jgi:hypothetical protein